MVVKKKKLTRRDITERILKKYDVNEEKIDFQTLKNFKEQMKELTDTRQPKKCTYKIWDIIVVTFIAILANCDNWEEIREFAIRKKVWFKNFLKLSGGIPSSKTYERIFSIINPKELEYATTYFVSEVVSIFNSDKDIISIDGKTDNGSSRNKTMLHESVKSLNVLNAYSNKYGICLASEMIDKKTNEIPTTKTILERLKIKDTIITWDALNTQKKNIEAVIKGKADYCVPIKSNHPVFFQELALYFNQDKLDTIKAKNDGITYKIEYEKSHGTIITYEYFQTEDVTWFEDLKKWKNLKSFACVKKTIGEGKNKRVEYRYYISSLLNDIELISKAIRHHWSVENKLHWHLDVTFKQDKNTTINKNALLNLQIMKKLALACLKHTAAIYDKSLHLIRFSIQLDFEKEIPRFFNILANF